MAADSATELRKRLHDVLDEISPSPAPVAAVLRRAKARRSARRALLTAGIAAGAAATVAAVVILPGMRHPAHPTAQPTTPAGGRVVIGHGIVGGRSWRVVVDPADDQLCAGVDGLKPTCVSLVKHAHRAGLASLSGAIVAVPGHYGSFGPPIWNSVFGTVRPDVTRLDVKLAGGRTIRLRPVAVAGYRWVGLIFPMGTDIARATAYAGQAELGYAVPFIGGELRPGTYFESWLRPGQPGPARRGPYIASGGSGGHSWNVLVLAGPWGYCVALEVPVTNGARQDCWAVGSLRSSSRVIMRWGTAPAVPRWIVGTARPAVAYLRLSLAGGRTARVRVTDVSGQRFYAMQIGPGPRVLRWGAFDAAGHRLYGGRGTPDAG